MSFEFKLLRRCDHRLFRQVHYFEDDRQTVRLNTLLGSSSSFEVRLNGNVASRDSVQQGWDLVKDEASLYSGQKKLLFRKKRKALDDWVELSYYAFPTVCPKCGGFDLLFDYEYSNLGRPFMVTEEQKLAQDMEKIILTVRGSNIYHTWYGTVISSLIGSKQPRALTKGRMQKEVVEALTILKTIQGKQESYQTLTDREFLYQILGVSVVETEDPTVYKIYAKVQTQAGGDASFSRNLKFDRGVFPDTTQLLSSRTAF